jgi:hypothetical protein
LQDVGDQGEGLRSGPNDSNIGLRLDHND